MSKLLWFAILSSLVILLACSGETPTSTPTAPPTAAPTEAPAATPTPTAIVAPTSASAPTNTPAPTATPAPTVAPDPTATPEPTPTPEPDPTVESAPVSSGSESSNEGDGRLAPLQMDNPEAIAAELSDSELACLAGSADVTRLLSLFESPELASPEEQMLLLNCLEDETVTRMFLSGLLGDLGPLSVDTSACINAGMEGMDPRSIMLSGIAGDEQGSMTASMSAFFLTISCLNEQEYEMAAPALGMNPGDRESLQCIMQELGGPEGMAQTLGGGDESALMAFFPVAIGCGLSMEGTSPGG